MSSKAIYNFLIWSALVLFLLIAGFLVTQLILQINAKVMLVVAKHNYPKGTIITNPEEMFETRQFYESDAPQGAISDIEELRNCTLNTDILEGQPVQSFFLERSRRSNKGVWNLDKKEEAHLAGIQSFALSMETDQVQGGFVLPGCYVDIAYEVENNKKSFSKIVAENVQVSAVDQTCNLYGDCASPNYCLKVTAEQAQTLKSQKGGRFVLTVRRDNFNPKGEFKR
jgi:Flp pilus assembly protein CpaB